MKNFTKLFFIVIALLGIHTSKAQHIHLESLAGDTTTNAIDTIGKLTLPDENLVIHFTNSPADTFELVALKKIFFDLDPVVHHIQLSLKVFLEGPYIGNAMSTGLNGHIPLVQPYNIDPWNYTGDESVASLPGTNIVDWVLVELRDALSTGNATGATSIGLQAAFLRNDGQIVDINGNPFIIFESSISENLFVVIHHRNHLSIISSTAVTESGGSYPYDFTQSIGQAYLFGQKILSDGKAAMIGGNAFANDGSIQPSDISNVWQTEAGYQGYTSGDLNLDYQINNLDKNDVWYPNQGAGSQVPE